jgi:GT2 family glycosyltransferase
MTSPTPAISIVSNGGSEIVASHGASIKKEESSEVASIDALAASPLVHAVVLNWNGADHTVQCVAALKRQTTPLKILVIDNGSTDDSCERLRQSGLDVHVLPENRGFAGGMNVGIQMALDQRAEFVWLVNNDAYPEATCLETLLGRMRRSDTAMVTPKILGLDGEDQTTGGLVDWRDGRLSTLMTHEIPAERTDGRWIVGTAPLVRASALRAHGLFDEGFFAYYEDIDLSVRFSRAGALLEVEPAAVVLHHGGASSGGSLSPLFEYLMIRNRWLFLSRNTPRRSHRVRWYRYLAGALRAASIYDQKQRPAICTAVLAGVSAARTGSFGRPGQLDRVLRLERILFTAPWKSARMLELVARGLERLRS